MVQSILHLYLAGSSFSPNIMSNSQLHRNIIQESVTLTAKIFFNVGNYVLGLFLDEFIFTLGAFLLT